MKRLYATIDAVEAEVLRALLRDRGIESALDEGDDVNAILVRDEDAAAAAETLAEHFEKLEGGRETREPTAVEKKDRGPKSILSRAGCLFLCGGWGIIPFGLMWYGATWQAAALIAGGILSLVAFVWILDLVAEKKDPTP